jgi:hypothetical protein
MNQEELRKKLSAEFVVGLKTLNKGGTKLTYLPISECVTRLNSVLGIGNWSSEVLSAQRDMIDPDWVIAHVRINVNLDGKVFSHEQYGGQKIKKKNDGEVLDLGDEFKGAVSDALKKAASYLEVGLYLARSDEALEHELQLTRCNESQINGIREDIGKLSPDEKTNFVSWWKEKNLENLDDLQKYNYDLVVEELKKRIANDPGRPFE